MSYVKNDQVFPAEIPVGSTHKIANAISTALRQDYGELTSAVKRIGRITGVHPRAIRNWYEGRNVPNSVHLLMLAQHSPNVLRVLLQLIGHGYMAEFISWEFSPVNRPSKAILISNGANIYGERLFTINVTLAPQTAAKLNQRQLWFLGLIQRGHEVRPADVSEVWKVTLRTAKSDLAGLKRLGLVRFVGARKNGLYVLGNV